MTTRPAITTSTDGKLTTATQWRPIHHSINSIQQLSGYHGTHEHVVSWMQLGAAQSATQSTPTQTVCQAKQLDWAKPVAGALSRRAVTSPARLSRIPDGYTGRSRFGGDGNNEHCAAAAAHGDPQQLLGYLTSMGVLAALILRVKHGRSYHVRTSLSRFSLWRSGLGVFDRA
jgi:hypothetical protein